MPFCIILRDQERVEFADSIALRYLEWINTPIMPPYCITLRDLERVKTDPTVNNAAALYQFVRSGKG